MKARRLALLVFVVIAVFILMGDVNLQTTGPTTTAFDLGQVVQSVTPYGLMTWLILSAERRYSELVKAQREERHWLLEVILTGKSRTSDEN